jgi:general secretion pathway protein L
MNPREGLRTHYRQWRQGLLACLPASLRRLADPRTTPWVLELANPDQMRVIQEFDDERSKHGTLLLDEGRLKGDANLKSLRSGNAVLVLRLPSEWVLRKRTTLPEAAAENLHQVIGFEMDRLTPFTTGQVYYDCQIADVDEGSGELAVDLVAIPRNRIDGLLESLSRGNLRISALDVQGGWEEMNLLPHDQRLRRSGLAILVNLLLWGGVLALLAAALAIPLWQKRELAMALEDRARAVQKEAQQVVQLRDRIAETREMMHRIPQRRAQLPTAIDTLNRLTGLLPDDTWVQQLELREGKLELRGLSRQATALIQTLEGEPEFEKVTFRSPVLQAGGEERFHLAAELVAEERLDNMSSGN